MKKAYLVKILQFLEEERLQKNRKAEENAFGKMNADEVLVKMCKKILGVGSCLLGEKEGQGTKEVVEVLKQILFEKE